MSNTNTGGPAFPTPRYERGDMYSLGMTLRDYFAAKAMQSYMNDDVIWRTDTYELASRAAYAVADAMLKARES
jgi:hypothetical protein